MQKASVVKQSASSDRSQTKIGTAANGGKSKDDNFDLEENDNWPEVDLGNLIIGLDADIDKASTRALSPSTSARTSSPSAAMSVSKTKAIMGSQTVTESVVGNGATPPTSSGPGGSSSSSSGTTSSDKSLKVKIKRTKPSSGSSRHPEGNLEVVQSNNSNSDLPLNGVEPNNKPVSGKSDLGKASGSSTPLNAADVISAVTTAVARQHQSSSSSTNKNVIGKVKLTSGPMAGNTLTLSKGGANGSPNQPQNGKISNGSAGASFNPRANGSLSPTSFSSSSSVVNGPSGANGNQNGPPPNKKQKVDASVSTDTGTITEPECLGPMDPGSSVTLEGIVWHETENGVLVINVTWRGKTYVGTLLDSTQHVHHWAPPSSRYTDSPTSEIENRTPKGRGKRGRGGHSELEVRKNLRSSKGKGRSGITFPPASPAKEKRKGSSKSDSDDKNGSGSGSEDGSSSKKRSRTSSQNSPEDDGDDSEKEEKTTKDGEKETKLKDEKEDDSMTPKDPEEEKYVPPPPLPYVLICPKEGCNKKYRQHSGLKFHVSFAHKELLNAQGEIKDTSEIERMEQEAKERLRKKEEAVNGGKTNDVDNATEADKSDERESNQANNPEDVMPNITTNNEAKPSEDALSTKLNITTTATTCTTSTTTPLGGHVTLPPLSASLGIPSLSQIKPNFTNLPGPPPDAKPIPVSAIEGVMTSRPPPPLLNGPPPVVPGAVTSGGPAITTPVSLMGGIPISSPLARATDLNARNPLLPKSVIRPPSNARPIVPATAPQLLPSGPLGPSAINLKPIQPRPTIMPEPTPNLALDELRKKKEPKKKKENSPGTSPPRSGSQNGSSPKSGHGHGGQTPEKSDNQQPPVKSPAYSDISDDGEETDKKKTANIPNPSNPSDNKPSFAAPFALSQYAMPPSARAASSPQLPTVPVSSAAPSLMRPLSRGSPSSMSKDREKQQQQQQQHQQQQQQQHHHPQQQQQQQPRGQPGPLDYQKLMQAYGLGPYHPGMDPNLHMPLLNMDPNYKAKVERELAEKEKALKDQIDRENRERSRKASGGIKEEHGHRSMNMGGHPMGGGAPEDLRKREHPGSPGGSLSVKSEFRETKSEPGKNDHKPPSVHDEGAKPTMETRGPPPGTQAYGYMQAQMLRQGFPGIPFEHLLASGVVNPLMLGAAGAAYGANPYMPPHMRPPFGPASPSDILRPPIFPPVSSTGSAEDLRSSNTKALELLQQHASQYYGSHKIHELQERARKSPNPDKFSHKARETLASASPTLNRKNPSTPTPPPAGASSANSSMDRSRSPPPLRHVHTHTHTHFGLGYPLLPPSSVSLAGVTPPAAHTAFSTAGFNPLMPPKPNLSGFPPK